MKLDFDGSWMDTDYYDSLDCENGIPWCLIDSSTWHILLPHSSPPRIKTVFAYPVLNRYEPNGWRWMLELGTWCLPLHRRCIHPFRPGFPARHDTFHRSAVLYTSYRPIPAGSSFFGSIPNGWQTKELPLKLVRR